jgi:hypothetical protein
MFLGQPSFRTEVKPGEKQRVGEAQSEASVEARVGEDAVSKLRVCFHHSVRACFAILQGGTTLGLDRTEMLIRINNPAGDLSLQFAEARRPLFFELPHEPSAAGALEREDGLGLAWLSVEQQSSLPELMNNNGEERPGLMQGTLGRRIAYEEDVVINICGFVNTSCIGSQIVLGVLAAGPRRAIRVPTQLVGEVLFGSLVSNSGERKLISNVKDNGPKGTALPGSTNGMDHSGIGCDGRFADSKPSRGVHVCHHFSELGGGSSSGEQALSDSGISEDPSA